MSVVNAVPAVDLARKYLDLAYDYAADVESGAIVACKWVKLAVKRWYRDLETGGDRGLYFDENAAARVFRFSGYCRQYEGEYAGQSLELQGWQCFIIANVFGWMRADGTRRFRIAYEKVARKNGKSTKLAFIASYGLLGDKEGGPRVYSAATKRDQAKELYDAAEAMIDQSPKLSRLVKTYNDRIVAKKTRGRLQPLSKDSKSMDGLNVHFGLIDELHAHRDSSTWDVIKSARGARKQPLIWAITTEGFLTDGPDADQQEYATKVLEGAIEDDSYFAIIYTLDDPKKWDQEEEWIKANPNMGVSVSLSDMREQCRMAKEIPTERIEFLTKRLDLKVRGEAKWMNLESFIKCKADYQDQEPFLDEPSGENRGADAWGGLDLSSVEDITALSFTIRTKKGKTKTFSRGYLPEGALARRLKKGDKSMEKFVQEGVLVLTPGETVDYDYIKADIRKGCAYFNVQGIAFDRWNSNQLVNDMIAEGVPMIEFGQGFGSMSTPMKELMVRVLNQTVEYNNSLLYWAMSNLVADINPAGDVKPAKDKIKEKIDPVVSLIMALGVMILMPPKKKAKSIYADGEI
jgi:phage terminase large subunit-like protein